MRVHLALIVLIGLILLVGVGCAGTMPDQTSTISTSSNWIVVNNQSTITVVVKNESVAIPNAVVSLTLDPSTMGSLDTWAPKTADGSGTATWTFTAGTKSGSVDITATIANNTVSVQKTVTQYIDHGVAYSVQFDFDNEVTVDTETPFTMSFTDRWGNPVDNKNPDDTANPHKVSLHIGSVTGAGAFKSTSGTYVQDLTTSTNSNGNATVTVRTDITGGENIIWMKPVGAISDQYKSIIGLMDAVPSEIAQQIAPASAEQVCDGAVDHVFQFIYTLHDKHGNVAKNQTLLLHTNWSGDSDVQMTTNEFGQVWLTYGPHDTAAYISVTATSLTNTSVNCTQVVWFYSTAPVNMVLMASPQTMGSLDAGSAIRSNVSAAVTDINGNAVHDETVTFTLGTPVYDGTYNSTYSTSPAWESTSAATVTAVTDENGLATVRFKPGSFDRNLTHLNYNDQATGHVTVTATWVDPSGNTVTKSVDLTWKNYPYLSVETSVNPITIGVNDTVDLTIKLKGDGWALQPNPIDVNLVLDRSGSMAWNINGGTYTSSSNPSRLSIAKSAATTFIGNMTVGLDRVGLYSYSSSVTHNAALQTPYTPVTTAINGLSATGATATRDATKQAIEDMIAHPNAGAVQAVIVMTDGDWNYEGSPAAHGTGWPTGSSGYSFSGSDLEPDNYRYYDGLGGTLVKPAYSYYYRCTDGEFTNQNLSIYAKNNNIRLYYIFFAGTPDPTAKSTLQTMAEATGGFYQQATTASSLNDAYTRIAGALKEEAGVNTTMQVKFDTVNVTGVTLPGAEVYDYVYDPSVTSGSTRIAWQDGVTNVTDQTDDWNDDQKLNFTIGTIKLNEVWQGTFRLKVKKSGSIEVFGNSSSIVFNNGADSMVLPSKYINVVENLTNSGWTMGLITLSSLKVNPTGGNVTEFLPVTWNMTYTGNITKSAIERVYYSNDNKQSWVQFDTKSNIAPCSDSPQSSNLDVRYLPAGIYYIRILGQADDAVGDEIISSSGTSVKRAVNPFIKLE
jgi:hypothetical protein